MTSTLDRRLLTHVRTNGLFSEPGIALLAVSGGTDSLALLDVMRLVAPDLGLEVAVAHVDHGIAPGSRRIAERVEALVGGRGLAVHRATLDLGARASETRARLARYRALRSLQGRCGARYLVTAHHADDQVETVLYRVLRGSGPAGLVGIPASGPDGLVRPLLAFTRRDLREWLHSRYPEGGDAVAIHDDPANADLRHDRSWLRHRVLPGLRERVEGVDRNLIGVAEEARVERAAWGAALREFGDLSFRTVQGGVEVARGPIASYDKMLSESLLRALAREVGCRLGAERAARLRLFASEASSGRILELGEGWVAEVVFDRLRLSRAAVASRDAEVPAVEWGGEASGSARFGGWTFSWVRGTAGSVERAAPITWVSEGVGEIRAMRRGERVIPLGGVGHRRVSRVLMEARVPRRERLTYPLVVRGGRIVWIPGICRTADELPEPGARALRIEAHR